MNEIEKHALYRFYSSTDELLYIGITLDPGSRWKQHAHDKAWWHEVANVTIETHSSRDAVFNAEREAIKSERPKYNIIHNRGPVTTNGTLTTPADNDAHQYTSTQNQWEITSRRSGHTRITDLHLHWEIPGDPITDDWLPDEISASELMSLWIKRYHESQLTIYWSLHPIHETAPFQVFRWGDHEDFLTYFYWPRSTITGEQINFNRLPVVDKRWSDDQADKGGFFQEVTGWKPSPLQPIADIDTILQRAGLTKYRQTHHERKHQ